MNSTPPSERDLDLGCIWNNSFAKLGNNFYTRLLPQPLPAPHWIGHSCALARKLGLAEHWLASQELLQALSGNRMINGTQPLASVYSGHQFGRWAGQLGDGRAVLLGETSGLEMQLKGSGRTPYSRMGDGRAVLRSSIREFLCSEAMHGLGIATTRALCVIGSDAPVQRETIETAAVLTRVAPSFIRFGHFEHYSANNQITQLKTLADYVIERFYPECRWSDKFAGNPYVALLEAVCIRTARMVAQWQAVGFCHGVMNTDNMSVLGLSLDYGPFQFLDAFKPNHICNHSDTEGRYAFNQQPNIAYWNLFCLGQSMLGLIGEPQLALLALDSFKIEFPATLHRLMCTKLGLVDVGSSGSPLPVEEGVNFQADKALIEDILKLLTHDGVDYTIFWRRLSNARGGTETDSVRDLFVNRSVFDAWLLRYSERIVNLPKQQVTDLMLQSNPKFVLRNYLCEQAIEQAKLKDFSGVATLLALLESPFEEHPGFHNYADFPPDWANDIQISCSS
jgi:uncharacterized protein YdiU (UPF0061 family)